MAIAERGVVTSKSIREIFVCERTEPQCVLPASLMMTAHEHHISSSSDWEVYTSKVQSEACILAESEVSSCVGVSRTCSVIANASSSCFEY